MRMLLLRMPTKLLAMPLLLLVMQLPLLVTLLLLLVMQLLRLLQKLLLQRLLKHQSSNHCWYWAALVREPLGFMPIVLPLTRGT
jgi:hypothetical protein